MAGPSDVECSARPVEALYPWHDQVVFMGGWADSKDTSSSLQRKQLCAGEAQFFKALPTAS
jgi:hypothetical protein